MPEQSVIIVGSGLGGLQCGYMLAKCGFKVTVLEQERQIGGCLQTFRRGNHLFNTGFHYVGGLGEGESLEWLFNYFNLMGLPWHKMDEDGFDEVVIGDSSFLFANGHERFVERLCEQFPSQKDNLERFVSVLDNVGKGLKGSLTGAPSELFGKSAFEFVEETISDPLLRKVLSGSAFKMQLDAKTLPLYEFAQISNSYIQSAWKLDGGGGLIVQSLADSIEKMGGEVLTANKVTSLNVENGRVSSVTVNGEKTLRADWIVSDLHPAVTLELIDKQELVRKPYKSRISSLKNSYGVFTASLVLKPGAVESLNRNVYIHTSDANLWGENDGVKSLLVNFDIPDGSGFAKTLDLMTPASWDDVAPWLGTSPMERGEEYEAFKRNMLQDCLRLAAKRFPGLEDGVESAFTSTPLTYHDYTSTPQGSAYGVANDFNNPMTTILSPKTPLSNLVLTGQSLNLHGVLGVSITSCFTCKEILGIDKVKSELGII